MWVSVAELRDSSPKLCILSHTYLPPVCRVVDMLGGDGSARSFRSTGNQLLESPTPPVSFISRVSACTWAGAAMRCQEAPAAQRLHWDLFTAIFPAAWETQRDCVGTVVGGCMVGELL